MVGGRGRFSMLARPSAFFLKNTGRAALRASVEVWRRSTTTTSTMSSSSSPRVTPIITRIICSIASILSCNSFKSIASLVLSSSLSSSGQHLLQSCGLYSLRFGLHILSQTGSDEHDCCALVGGSGSNSKSRTACIAKKCRECTPIHRVSVPAGQTLPMLLLLLLLASACPQLSWRYGRRGGARRWADIINVSAPLML